MLNTAIVSPAIPKGSINTMIQDAKLEIDVLTQLFDYIDYPIILIDRDGGLVWKNQQGGQILRDQQALMVRDQKIMPAQEVFDRRWRERLAAAADGEEALLFVDDGDMGRAISINPLACSRVSHSTESNLVYGLLVIILGKSSPCEPLALRRFSRSYKITPAEQRIVAQLMSGLAPGKIALTNSVAVTTVRTQIKSVLCKTGINSMRDLMLTLSRLPPISMAR